MGINFLVERSLYILKNMMLYLFGYIFYIYSKLILYIISKIMYSV